MKKIASLVLGLLLVPTLAWAAPSTSVYGVTNYNPDLTWNGFTVLAGNGSVKMIDMNGNLVHEWNIEGATVGDLSKLYPGGIMATQAYRNPPETVGSGSQNGLAILDFEGNVLRFWNKLYQADQAYDGMYVAEDGGAWYSRIHHDYQIEGSSVGYYYPGAEINPNGKMLLLTNATVDVPEITGRTSIMDDRIVIVDGNGEIIFDWYASAHFDEFANMRSNASVMTELGNRFAASGERGREFDLFHINAASWLGENKWYDEDPVKYAMFHPENIIFDAREPGHMGIIDHVSGAIVWQVAPPYMNEDSDMGVFLGVHHTHMIPKGLPGAGNILVFDNGLNPGFYGDYLNTRASSRVVEFNPVTKQIVWEYSSALYSNIMSSAQRLPNGNTLICEATSSRLIEVTPDKKIVWEYVSPYAASTYRAYRAPYEWVPQLPQGSEVPVTKLETRTIVMPNDNGDLPLIYPAADASRAPSMERVSPVLTPVLDGRTDLEVLQGHFEGEAAEPEVLNPAFKQY